MSDYILKDFVGLNLCIYDPCAEDSGSFRYTTDPNRPSASNYNQIGYSPLSQYWYNGVVNQGNIGPITNPTEHFVMVLLNLHRNGPWGYGTWKQIRASDNHLIRYQKRNNIFSFVKEPGKSYEVTISGSNLSQNDRFGEIKQLTEPVVVGNYKPLELVGGAAIMNPETNKNEIRSVSVKTTFANETAFFANEEVNEYYNTILEDDKSYEDFKGLYLKGALAESSSPMERFNFMVYKQTVWPKMKYSYLKKTRSRLYFRFIWETRRSDRERKFVNSVFGTKILPRQSIAVLDAPKILTPYSPQTSYNGYNIYYNEYSLGGGPVEVQVLGSYSPPTAYVSQYNTSGSAGVLQNTYSHLYSGLEFDNKSIAAGIYLHFQGVNAFSGHYPPSTRISNLDNVLTASCFYSYRHTLVNLSSLRGPTGMKIDELINVSAFETSNNSPRTINIGFGHPYPQTRQFDWKYRFGGPTPFDGPQLSDRPPSYDSYDNFSVDIKGPGQGYTVVPEFRISSHVETYASLGVTEQLESIFELSGATKLINTTTKNTEDFYTVLSNTDFLKHFDLIRKDHQDFVDPSIITLRCKAVKKFLPYEGFYPADRCVQLTKAFYNSYKDSLALEVTGSPVGHSSFALQGFLAPLFAPGVLFNTIKSGVAVDFPINHSPAGGVYCNQWGIEHPPTFTPTVNSDGMKSVMITGSNFTGINPSQWGDLTSIWDQRIPFEALIQPATYLANRDLYTQDPHPWAAGSTNPVQQFFARWQGAGDNNYVKMMHNFLAEVPNFYLQNGQFSNLVSLESQDPNFGVAEKGKYYAMRIKMYRSKNTGNGSMEGIGNANVTPPQDLYGNSWKFGTEKHKMRETFTMYSRPSAFGPPLYGGPWASASYGNYTNTPHGRFPISGSDSLWGYNWAFTPPYYHGDAWCDVIFKPTQSKKYTVEEIISEVKEWPYYSRFWWNGTNDALRDLTGYRSDHLHNRPPNNSNQTVWGDRIPGGPYWGSMVWLQRVRKHGTFTSNWVDADNHLAAVDFTHAPIEGPYKDYSSSTWNELIEKGKIGKATGLGMLSLCLNGEYEPTWFIPNYNINYVYNGPDWRLNQNQVAPTFPQPGDVGVVGNYLETTPAWGNRYTMDGWANSSASWAGPPMSTKVQENYINMPSHPYYLNMNAMQLNSSLNLFGVGSVRKKTTINDLGEAQTIQVADSQTNEAKSRWIIQPKFETPMLNFNKYSNLKDSGCTVLDYISGSQSRGMWHQLGEIPKSTEGVFYQVEDIPFDWFKGALGLDGGTYKANVRSLADLVGFPTEPVKIGKIAKVQQISECVVAVPFFEEDGERRFFTIPREDINDTVAALRREIEPGVFIAGGPPKVGNTIIHMVKMMQNYVFPPPMDFVKYTEIQPFAMYIFEFTQNLSQQDVSHIWQNLSPECGRSHSQSEVSITHEFLAHELLGGGSVIANGKLNENAKGNPIKSEIQWMMFKVKKRAKTDYYETVVATKGTISKESDGVLEGVDLAKGGIDTGITYNWPYDYFSLVELVKLDAEITFAKVENDDKGNRQIMPIDRPTKEETAQQEEMEKDISIAAGNTSNQE